MINRIRSTFDKLNAVMDEALADSTARAKLASIGQDICRPDRQNGQSLDANQKVE